MFCQGIGGWGNEAILVISKYFACECYILFLLFFYFYLFIFFMCVIVTVSETAIPSLQYICCLVEK